MYQKRTKRTPGRSRIARYIDEKNLWDKFFTLVNNRATKDEIESLIPFALPSIKNMFLVKEVVWKYWLWCKANNREYVSIYVYACDGFQNEHKWLKEFNKGEVKCYHA